MRGEASPPVEPVNGSDRRRFPRQRLYADASVSTARGLPFACKIRDFCLAGMAISWLEHSDDKAPLRAPNKGDAVTVAFTIPNTPNSFQVHARVARVLTDGLGLEFSGQDPAALQALQVLANRFESSAFESTQSRGGSAGGNGKASDSAILNRIREVTDRLLQRQLGEFSAQIEALIFRQAKQARSNSEQTELLDALPVINKQREKIASVTKTRIMQGFNAPTAPSRLSETVSNKTFGLDTLSLVGKDEFEDLLALADIISRAEQRYKNKLFDMEQRLSLILQRDIDRENDPLGPSAICHAFAASLQEIGLNESQRRAAYHAFQDAVVSDLGNLYEHINQTLIDSSVMPTLRPTVRKAGTPNLARSMNSAAQTGETGRKSTTTPLRDTLNQLGMQDDIAEQSQDLALRAAQTLFGLNRMASTLNLSATNSGSLAAFRAATMDLASATNSYSQDELLRALINLQQQAPKRSDHNLASGDDIKDRLLQALQMGGSEQAPGTGGRTRGLRQSDADALDLVNGILGALSRDNFATDPLRQEINRLQIPLHALALTDPAFFSNKEHPARQFINRVAQLYEGTQAAGNTEPAAVSQVVDRLLANIGKSKDVGNQAFTPALQELDQLIERQAKEYAENVAQVVAECSAQQSFLRAKRKQTGNTDLSTTANLIPPGTPPELHHEFRVWLERVRRLRVPDLVRFDQGDGRSRQMRVAWIGDNYEQFVFADAHGRKANSTTQQELAMLLRRGKAAVVEQDDLSLVDRALHGVLYQMHERIERQAQYDPTTGLMNRKRFLQRLDSAIQSVVRDGVDHALSVIVMSGHERLSEEFGKDRQKALQHKISELIGKFVGNKAELACVGDNAYALLVESGTASQNQELLEPCLQALNKVRVKVNEHIFTLSARLTSLNIDGLCGDSEELLRNLEQQAYTASLGATPDSELNIEFDNASHNMSVDWPVQLRDLLAAQNLDLYVSVVNNVSSDEDQPLRIRLDIGVADVNDRLQLFRHTVLPADFNDDLIELDRRVISECLTWFREHREQLEEFGGCSLRLHAPTLKDERTVDFILEQLIESSIPPGLLCIEIAETDVAHCLTEAERLIRTLREFGCGFCISAYGRGELKHGDLERLQIDCLMIDPRMVKEIDHSAADYAVVKSTTEIAHLLGKTLIAEQVPSASARAKLAEIGLDYAELEYAPARRLRG